RPRRPRRTSRRTLGRIARRRGSRPDTGGTSWAWRRACSQLARTPAVRPLWQREGERGPFADLAFNPDPPPVQLHELLGQRQAQACALLLTGVVPADLAELLEDRRLILGRDPDPRIADGDRDGIRGRRRRGGQADPAPFGGELHGVGEEIQQ